MKQVQYKSRWKIILVAVLFVARLAAPPVARAVFSDSDEVFEYETTNIKGAKVKAKYDLHLSLCFDKKSDDKPKDESKDEPDAKPEDKPDAKGGNRMFFTEDDCSFF